VTSATRFCGSCGGVVPVEDRFCSTCGRPMPPVQTGPQADPSRLTVPPAKDPVLANEQTIFQNELGRITDHRLIFESGGGRGSHSRRDVPLRSISSVVFETKRHPFIAALFAAIGAVALVKTPNSGGVIIAIILFGLAVSLFLGSRSIQIALTDGDKQAIRVRPMRAKRAQPFVDALRNQLFKNAPQDAQGSAPRWG